MLTSLLLRCHRPILIAYGMLITLTMFSAVDDTLLHVGLTYMYTGLTLPAIFLVDLHYLVAPLKPVGDWCKIWVPFLVPVWVSPSGWVQESQI